MKLNNQHPKLNLSLAHYRLDRAFAPETVDLGSLPDRVKPKTIKIDIHSFLLTFSNSRGQCEASSVCNDQGVARLEDRKVPSLSPGLGNFVHQI